MATLFYCVHMCAAAQIALIVASHVFRERNVCTCMLLHLFCDFILEYKHETHWHSFIWSILVLYVLWLYVCLSAILTDTIADTHIFLPSICTHSQKFVKLTLGFKYNRRQGQDLYCGTHNRRQGQDVYCGTYKRRQGQDVYCGTHNRRQGQDVYFWNTQQVSRSGCLLWDTQQNSWARNFFFGTHNPTWWLEDLFLDAYDVRIFIVGHMKWGSWCLFWDTRGEG